MKPLSLGSLCGVLCLMASAAALAAEPDFHDCKWTAEGSYFADDDVYKRPPKLVDKNVCATGTGKAATNAVAAPICVGTIFCSSLVNTKPTEAKSVACAAVRDPATNAYVCPPAPTCAVDPATTNALPSLPKPTTASAATPGGTTPKAKGGD